MRRILRLPILFLLVIALVPLAACGGDDDDVATDDARTTTTAAGATPSTGADKAADKSFAERIVLTKADIPAGFTQDPDDKSDAGDDEDDPMDACMGEESKELDDATTGEAESPDFTKETAGDVLTIGSSSTVFASEADATKAMALLQDPKLGSCLGQAIADEAGKDPDTPPIKVASIDALPYQSRAEQTAALRMNLTFEVGGQALPFVMDMVVLRKDRATSAVLLGHLGGPFPDAEGHAVVDKLANRMAAA